MDLQSDLQSELQSDLQSELQSDCHANNQNIKLVSSVDPPVNERTETRRMSYRRKADEYIKAQEKITVEAKKNSYPPILFRAYASGVLIYPKERSQIVLLKCDT